MEPGYACLPAFSESTLIQSLAAIQPLQCGDDQAPGNERPSCVASRGSRAGRNGLFPWVNFIFLTILPPHNRMAHHLLCRLSQGRAYHTRKMMRRFTPPRELFSGPYSHTLIREGLDEEIPPTKSKIEMIKRATHRQHNHQLTSSAASKGPACVLLDRAAWECPPSQGCVTDTREKESPLPVYDPKVEGQ
ncbi:hypothetical protein CRG98_037616 [Punica granatum]|uniref:Uncharacterized protein n=1 Tax=Punica granatum TaxID=22663 RepID=A0A2I0IDB6_PUNGR|nr:hypothetical protein CRG98_037616 [Punica granatum]